VGTKRTISNDKDWGTNPCCEIALRPFQFCNLCEVNASDIESQEDFENRVRAASFIGTLQAGYTDFHYLRDIWKRTTEKDALIGVGMTGIGSGVVLGYDMKKAAKVVKEENERVAGLIGINKSARTTTVKPSGTSSLVLGTSVACNTEVFPPTLYESVYEQPCASVIVTESDCALRPTAGLDVEQ